MFKISSFVIKPILHPSVFIAIFFLLLPFLHRFERAKIKKYFAGELPINLQTLWAALNIYCVLQNCPSFYQPVVLLLVTFVQIILTIVGLNILNRPHAATGNKITSFIFLYAISGIGYLIFAYTTRFITLG